MSECGKGWFGSGLKIKLEKIIGQFLTKFFNDVLDTNTKTQSLNNLNHLFFCFDHYGYPHKSVLMCNFWDWLYEGRWHLQIREWGKGLFGPEIPKMGKMIVAC